MASGFATVFMLDVKCSLLDIQSNSLAYSRTTTAGSTDILGALLDRLSAQANIAVKRESALHWQ